MICILFVLLFLNCDGYFLSNNLNVTRKQQTTRKTIVSVIFTNATLQYENGKNSSSYGCRWLKGFGKQKKQCEKRKGFAQVLNTARQLAVTQCEDQFRYDRWNCSYKKSMFQKIYRETALMYAMSASAIMFSTAKACNNNQLKNCYCAEQPRYPPKGDWKWGGCGDNTKKARKIAKRFLHLSQEVDGPTEILNHNTNVGFNLIKQSEEKSCYCHGVSASCALKTCWKVIKPFQQIANKLKEKYRNAKPVDMDNIGIVNKQLSEEPSTRLLYLAQSPTFCDHTVGRRCTDNENCATLCCGRGHDHYVSIVNKVCKYRWHEQYLNVSYNICKEEQDNYICK